MTPDEIRRGERDLHDKALLFNLNNLVTTENSIRKSLWTFAVFVFTFSSPMFANFNGVGLSEKVLLTVGWSLLTLSILFGIVDAIKDMFFYEAHAEFEGKAKLIFTKEAETSAQLEEMRARNNELWQSRRSQKQGLIVGKRYFLYAQMLTWLSGFILVLIAAILIVFAS